MHRCQGRGSPVPAMTKRQLPQPLAEMSSPHRPQVKIQVPASPAKMEKQHPLPPWLPPITSLPGVSQSYLFHSLSWPWPSGPTTDRRQGWVPVTSWPKRPLSLEGFVGPRQMDPTAPTAVPPRASLLGACPRVSGLSSLLPHPNMGPSHLSPLLSGFFHYEVSLSTPPPAASSPTPTPQL